jgi:hypothetical protein
MVVAMAHKAGCGVHSLGKREAYLNQEKYTFDSTQLEAFANLIRQDEREQCAEMVFIAGHGFCGSNVEIVMHSLAKSIKERGE